jgi:hypothetical protein
MCKCLYVFFFMGILLGYGADLPIAGVSREGYIEIEILIDEVVDGAKLVPLELSFTTSPSRHSAGFGDYWGITLFDSNAKKTSQSWYHFVDPSGLERFFLRDSSKSNRVETYKMPGADTILEVIDDKTVIRKPDGSGAYYELRDGQLVSFGAGRNDLARLYRSGADVPIAIYSESQRRKIVDFVSGNMRSDFSVVSEISTGSRMGDSVLLSYRNFEIYDRDGSLRSAYLLSGVVWPGAKSLEISYDTSIVTDESDRALAASQKLVASELRRFGLSVPDSSNGANDQVSDQKQNVVKIIYSLGESKQAMKYSWWPANGRIAEINEMPVVILGKQPDKVFSSFAPVAIATVSPIGDVNQMWAFDPRSGVEYWKDGSGSTVIKKRIMSPGLMYMETRDVKVLNSAADPVQWLRRTFDSSGRKIRESSRL